MHMVPQAPREAQIRTAIQSGIPRERKSQEERSTGRHRSRGGAAHGKSPRRSAARLGTASMQSAESETARFMDLQARLRKPAAYKVVVKAPAAHPESAGSSLKADEGRAASGTTSRPHVHIVRGSSGETGAVPTIGSAFAARAKGRRWDTSEWSADHSPLRTRSQRHSASAAGDGDAVLLTQPSVLPPAVAGHTRQADLVNNGASTVPVPGYDDWDGMVSRARLDSTHQLPAAVDATTNRGDDADGGHGGEQPRTTPDEAVVLPVIHAPVGDGAADGSQTSAPPSSSQRIHPPALKPHKPGGRPPARAEASARHRRSHSGSSAVLAARNAALHGVETAAELRRGTHSPRVLPTADGATTTRRPTVRHQRSSSTGSPERGATSEAGWDVASAYTGMVIGGGNSSTHGSTRRRGPRMLGGHAARSVGPKSVASRSHAGGASTYSRATGPTLNTQRVLSPNKAPKQPRVAVFDWSFAQAQRGDGAGPIGWLAGRDASTTTTGQATSEGGDVIAAANHALLQAEAVLAGGLFTAAHCGWGIHPKHRQPPRQASLDGRVPEGWYCDRAHTFGLAYVCVCGTGDRVGSLYVLTLQRLVRRLPPTSAPPTLVRDAFEALSVLSTALSAPLPAFLHSVLRALDAAVGPPHYRRLAAATTGDDEHGSRGLELTTSRGVPVPTYSAANIELERKCDELRAELRQWKELNAKLLSTKVDLTNSKTSSEVRMHRKDLPKSRTGLTCPFGVRCHVAVRRVTTTRRAHARRNCERRWRN